MMTEAAAKDNSRQEVPQGDLSAEAPKIFGEKILPIIQAYRGSLRESVDLSTKDWRFGEISESDLKRNEKYLEDLEQILGEYAENPSTFKVVHFSFSEQDGDRFRLTFKRGSDPERLPTEVEKAVTELNFELQFGRAMESEEERLAAVSLTRPPAEAVARFIETAPREIQLTIRAVKAHYSQFMNKIRLDFLPGIIVSLSSQLEKPILEGVVYVGSKRFKTDPEEVDLLASDFAVFNDHIRSIFKREAGRKK